MLQSIHIAVSDVANWAEVYLPLDSPNRCGGLRDDKNELPGEFMDELFKWALECEYWRPLLHHPGSFIMFMFYQLKYHF